MTTAMKELQVADVKTVRKPLAERWGSENVTVRKGRGSVYKTIRAHITVQKPHDCFCQPLESYCGRCRERLAETREEAEARAQLALREAGQRFYRYTDDMGVTHDEFLLQVHLKRDNVNTIKDDSTLEWNRYV